MQRTLKKKVIKKFAQHTKDTGSARVQVAILTQRISDLSKHLQLHRFDMESRRGLLGLVAKRRKLLTYIKDTKPQEYAELSEQLSLKN
jgi:small subunit ribosomal protein S15